MNSTVAGLLQVGALLVVLALVYRPLGDHMARIYTSEKHWRVEKFCYRLVRVDPGAVNAPPSETAAAIRKFLSRDG